MHHPGHFFLSDFPDVPLDNSADEFDQFFQIVPANPNQCLFIESDLLVHRDEKNLGRRWQLQAHPIDIDEYPVRRLLEKVSTSLPLGKLV